jgi:hypothetical protein
MQISVVERRNGEKDGKYGCYVASKFQVSSSAHPYLAGALLPPQRLGKPQRRRLATRLERLGVEAPPLALGCLDAF